MKPLPVFGMIDRPNHIQRIKTSNSEAEVPIQIIRYAAGPLGELMLIFCITSWLSYWNDIRFYNDIINFGFDVNFSFTLH